QSTDNDDEEASAQGESRGQALGDACVAKHPIPDVGTCDHDRAANTIASPTSLALKLQMPSRTKVPFMRLMIEVCVGDAWHPPPQAPGLRPSCSAQSRRAASRERRASTECRAGRSWRAGARVIPLRLRRE